MSRVRQHNRLETKVRELEAELQQTKQALASSQQSLHVPQPTATRAVLATAPPLGDQIRFLFVGPHQVSVHLHLDLLPMATQEWLIANEVRYDPTGLNFPCYPLPNQDANTVNLYRLWLYTGSLFSRAPEDVDMEDDGEAEVHADAEWHKLILMYLFGTEARDESFADNVIVALVEKVKESGRYPTGLASEVYAHTKYDDRLRKLYVDLHVWVGQGAGVKAPHEDAQGPRQFLDDVRMKKFVAGRKIYEANVKAPYENRLCGLYHKHEITPVCGEADIEVVDLTADDDRRADTGPQRRVKAWDDWQSYAARRRRANERNDTMRCDDCMRCTIDSRGAVIEAEEHYCEWLPDFHVHR